MNNLQQLPLVSVWCPVYNHGKYIRQCLDGLVKQQTTFIFEILIHDDASTDGTVQILKEYEKRYSHLLKCIYQTTNQLSLDRSCLIRSCYKKAQGKYIALCEGDDYWIDPFKLQKQVDFLDANPEYAICYHEVMVIKNGETFKDFSTPVVPEETDILELAKGNFMHTPSVVFRNRLFNEFPVEFSTSPVGDYFLHMLNARYGKIKRINQVMAVYRVHDEGIHTKKTQAQKDDEWLTQLSLMIPYFDGAPQNILIDKFLQFAVSVLTNNKNLSLQRQNIILRTISEIKPDFLMQLFEENEKLKCQLEELNKNKSTLFHFLKKLISK